MTNRLTTAYATRILGIVLLVWAVTHTVAGQETSSFASPSAIDLAPPAAFSAAASPLIATPAPTLVPAMVARPAEESPQVNMASPLASATDDPDWVDQGVQAAGYHADSCLPALECPKCVKVGSISVKPYGILWGDMIFASSRTYPGFFTLWVESEETQGESAFEVDARRSRVGADITGPTIDMCGGLVGGGKVEVDFFGGFVIPNTTDVRLRHVYFEAKNEDVRLLVGQTWDVVSPLWPNTVNFSVGWAGGNIGFRRSQFRAERFLHLSDDLTLTFQGALAQNIVPDLASGGLSAGVSREPGNWPMLQARTAVTFAGLHGHPTTIGVSGHYGETGFDFANVSPGPLRLPPEDDARFTEWSINADINMPLGDRLGFHGEIFRGSNLSNLLGGIVQGVCPCTRIPIRSTGGWGEVWYDWGPRVTTHFGFGIDDPDNDDSLIGRTYNRMLYANVFLKLTEQLRTGFEVSSWRTSYQNKTLNEPDPADRIAFPTLPGESTILEWTVRYHF